MSLMTMEEHNETLEEIIESAGDLQDIEEEHDVAEQLATFVLENNDLNHLQLSWFITNDAAIRDLLANSDRELPAGIEYTLDSIFQKTRELFLSLFDDFGRDRVERAVAQTLSDDKNNWAFGQYTLDHVLVYAPEPFYKDEFFVQIVKPACKVYQLTLQGLVEEDKFPVSSRDFNRE